MPDSALLRSHLLSVPDFGILVSLESVIPSLSAHGLVFYFFGKNKAMNHKKAALRGRNTIYCPSLSLIPALSTTALVLSSSAPSQKWLPPPLFQGHQLLLSAPLCAESCSFNPEVLNVMSQGALSRVWRDFWLSPLGRALSSGWRAGMPLNILQCTEQAPP